jgi:radical SAM superfamily enzyme YgiQ (UPF0313 family)
MSLNVSLVLAPAGGPMCPPLGIAVLKSVLQRRGHRVRAFDLNLKLYHAAGPALQPQWQPARHPFWLEQVQVEAALERGLESNAVNCVRDILETKPRVVGFTTLYSTEHASLWLARRIKEADPACLIVFGGPQASRHAAGPRLLDSGVVDVVVEGEGEETFAELLECVERGLGLDRCKGLLLKQGGQVVSTGARPLIADLSALPPADFSDFYMRSYTRPGMIPVSLSRGCPNECAFCYEVAYWERFRVRKAESLLAEIELHRRTLPKLDVLFFHDSLVNGHMGELRRFAQGLVDRDLRVAWGGQAVIRKEMTRQTLELLRRSGCRWLSYGLETASFSVMLKMGKHLARGAQLDRIVRDTFEAGIKCDLNFMFGFPGETEADFQMTLDFVRRNKDWISTVHPSPGFCDFHPGTYGHRRPDDLGIEIGAATAHWISKDGSSTYLTRLARFERFLDLVYDLRINCGYPYRKLHLRNTIIGNYHYAGGRFAEAAPYLERALAEEPPDESSRLRLMECLRKSGRLATG